MFLSPIHCCDVTKHPYLLSGELCTSPLHSNRLFVYTVWSRRVGQCFSVLRTRHTDVVGDSSGRSYVTDQWHNVPLLRTHDINPPLSTAGNINLLISSQQGRFPKAWEHHQILRDQGESRRGRMRNYVLTVYVYWRSIVTSNILWFGQRFRRVRLVNESLRANSLPIWHVADFNRHFVSICTALDSHHQILCTVLRVKTFFSLLHSNKYIQVYVKI